MKLPEIKLRLPDWIYQENLIRENRIYQTIEDRMSLTIDLARLNIEHNTGGPFGAAIFERQSGLLVSVGVNLVESHKCSIAHAEMVAICIAQQVLQNYDLGASGMPQHELVTSTEPCAMCLGAIPWSGVMGLICGARDEDARAIGFDEGNKPLDWEANLQKHGIDVQRDVLRDSSRQVMLQYLKQGGSIYNSRQSGN